MGQERGPIFVGRQHELDELAAALDVHASGRGGLVLIVGEPGIGKTRLADEFAARAAARGVRAQWGRCWEAEGRPPYWPWLQIVRGLAPSADGAGRPEVSSSLAQIVGAPAIGGGPDSESARFRLFDATAAWLKGRAALSPLLLVLDDAHWADLPSLRLLEFVAHTVHDAPLLVVATYREVEARQQPAIAAALAQLGRSGRSLPLRGLSAEEVGRLVAATVTEPLSPAMLERLHRETEGNPFFIDEVVRGIRGRAEGAAHWLLPGASGLPISQGIRGAIRQRLTPISPASRHVLATAAVLGREFSLPLLAAVCGSTVEDLLAALAAPLEWEILARSAGAADRYRFAHALIRETLYEELPPMQRVALHRSAARLLETRHHGNLEAHLAQLAHHYFEAAGDGEADKALEYAERAGRQGMEVLAYEEAAEHFRRALLAFDLRGAGDASRRAALLLALGEAHNRAGQVEAATHALRSAAALARQLGAGEMLAQAAIGLCGRSGLFWTEFGRSDDGLIRLLSEALAGLGDQPSPLRAQVMARLATELCWAADAGRGEALSREAVAIARRAGEPRTLGYALLGRILCISGPDHIVERQSAASEILALTDVSGDWDVAVNALMWRVGDALQLGDVAALRAASAALVHRVQELRQPADLFIVSMVAGGEAMREGRFADAQRCAEQVVAEPAPRANAVQMASALLFLVRRDRGGIDELEGGIKSIVHQYPNVAVWRACLALLYADSGRADAAQSELEQMLGAGLQRISRDLTWPYTMACLAEVSARSAGETAAALLYDTLVPYADRNVVAGPFYYLGPVAYYLGLLAVRLRRWDEARQHLEVAADRARALGAQPFLTRILLGLADVRRAAGEVDSANQLLDDALAIADRLGMEPLRDEAGRQRSRSVAVDLGAEPHAMGRAVFRREGEYWTIAYQGAPSRLRDGKGLRYIARLLREPGRQLHVIDLTGSRPPAESVLQADRRRALGQRLAALRAEVEEAERCHDPGRRAAAGAALDCLGEDVAAAVGLDGRNPPARLASERARVTVTKAIHTALRQIRVHDPALARLLASTIHTGAFCRYEPLNELPLTWEL